MKYLEVMLFVATHKRMLLFLICVCFMGMGYVFISTFLFIFLRSLGAPDILLGVSITATVIVEVPLFRSAEKLYAHFSDRQLFLAAMFGWCCRVVGYSLLENPWLVLLLEPFHGLSFGLMWLAGVHLTGAQFPPHLAASAFGFLHTSAFGIGPFFGNIAGGQMYEHLGPRWMFKTMAAAMFVVAVIFLIADRTLEKLESTSDKRSTQRSTPPTPEIYSESSGLQHETPRNEECMVHLYDLPTL
jgi:MFS family permease